MISNSPPHQQARKKPLSLSAASRNAFLARRNALVSAHLELVHKIAASLSRSLPPCFELDDLISVGYVGLVHAATRFRPAAHGGAPFDSYARPRIRGAILDSVRRRHWVENTRASVDSIQQPERTESLQQKTPPFEMRMDTDRASDRVRQAIDQLPERLRNLMLLYYSDDMPTLDVVGQEFGVGASGASHLHRQAIALVRQQLAA